MATANTGTSSQRKPLRLWPAVVIVIVQWLLRLGLPVVSPDMTIYAVLTGFAGSLAVIVWWLFFSRAPWSERLGAPLWMAVALFATWFVVDKSIATGAMGMLLPLFAVPLLTLALVVWAVLTRNLADRPRRAALVAAVLMVCGSLMLIRTGGFTGGFENDIAWRWSPTPEERLLAAAKDEPLVSAPTISALAPADAAAPTIKEPVAPGAGAVNPPVVEPALVPPTGSDTRDESLASSAGASGRAEWPGFRGGERNSVIHGVRIATDWAASPPVEMWRRPIGPGWSSFAVQGDLLYTQEQRGDDEIVACYRVSTGEPVWRHRDAARFWESNAGAGPRATPTLHNGRVYAFGATGLINVLDARSGALIWSRNAATDTDTKIPDWGFSSSPLVVDDLVIVAASGRLVAYDLATGKQRWLGPERGGSYSSPQLFTINGVPQVVLLSDPGATSVAPATGAVLWQQAGETGGAIVQPAAIGNGDILFSTGAFGVADVHRIAVANGAAGWKVEERWGSNGLKPVFNDFVIHKGHAFGFDGSILASINLEDGKRAWKGGRYGNGQLVLLADQDLLLVLSEEGALALVSATTEKYVEIARVPAIEGKTWNHPVVVGNVVLIRNGEEMAAFRLPVATR